MVEVNIVQGHVTPMLMLPDHGFAPLANVRLYLKEKQSIVPIGVTGLELNSLRHHSVKLRTLADIAVKSLSGTGKTLNIVRVVAQVKHIIKVVFSQRVNNIGIGRGARSLIPANINASLLNTKLGKRECGNATIITVFYAAMAMMKSTPTIFTGLRYTRNFGMRSGMVRHFVPNVITNNTRICVTHRSVRGHQHAHLNKMSGLWTIPCFSNI